MIEREKIIKLYDIYSNLLTENQKKYFEEYYFEDLSLSEISENYEVSKSFVSKTIKKVETKLFEYENSLKLFELNTKIREIASFTKDIKIKNQLEELMKWKTTQYIHV